MEFVQFATLQNQSLTITPRLSGQIVRFGGSDRVTTAETPIRVQGTGMVQLSSGWWTNVLITDVDVSMAFFDGDTPDTETERTRWVASANESETAREVRRRESIPISDEDYADLTHPYHRVLHDVSRISGPLVQEEVASHDKRHVGRVVEFSLLAHNPHVYSLPRELELSPALPTVVQDVLYNLVSRPSAEVASGTVVWATNFSTNPSLDVDGAGWDGTVAAVSGSGVDPFYSEGRVVGELAAAGTASYRARILGNNTAASGVADLAITQVVNISSRPANARVSVSIWAALMSVVAGTGSGVQSLTVTAEWLNSSDAQVGSTVIGTTAVASELNGRPFMAKSIAPPAGAAKVRVKVTGRASWVSSATHNSDIRLYADALAVTAP